MPASAKIIELRELLAARHPSAPRRPGAALSTGLGQVDALLDGGLPVGSVTEIVCPQSGGGLLLTALLRSTFERKGFLALIDGVDSFDPAGFPEAALARLLWVRSQSAARALQAADLLLRDGNLTLVVMDLRFNPARETSRVPSTSWYRLQRAVEPSVTAFAVLTRQPLVSAARPRIALKLQFDLNDFERRQAILMERLHATLARNEPVRRIA